MLGGCTATRVGSCCATFQEGGCCARVPQFKGLLCHCGALLCRSLEVLYPRFFTGVAGTSICVRVQLNLLLHARTCVSLRVGHMHQL